MKCAYRSPFPRAWYCSSDWFSRHLQCQPPRRRPNPVAMDRIAGDGQSVPTDDVFGSGLAIQLRNASTGAPVPNAPTAFTITLLRETAFPGEVFANPLVVRVLNAQGAPPPEQDVVLTFSISGWAAFPDRADSVDVQLTTDGTATAPSMTAERGRARRDQRTGGQCIGHADAVRRDREILYTHRADGDQRILLTRILLARWGSLYRSLRRCASRAGTAWLTRP